MKRLPGMRVVVASEKLASGLDQPLAWLTRLANLDGAPKLDQVGARRFEALDCSRNSTRTSSV
jgi:hypothetical protein